MISNTYGIKIKKDNHKQEDKGKLEPLFIMFYAHFQ
jgi:hypothetical protein